MRGQLRLRNLPPLLRVVPGAVRRAERDSLTAAVRYAEQRSGGTIGVESQSSAAELMLSSNAAVAGLGGGLPGDTRTGSQTAFDVVAKTCRAVTLSTGSGTVTMYDCQGRAAAILQAAKEG